MARLHRIDAVYARFCSRLPDALEREASALGTRLRLVPDPSIPWSETFGHEVTLGAPLLFAEGLAAPEAVVEDALTAHVLAVIGAFTADRIVDGQVEASPALSRLVSELAAGAEAALRRLDGRGDTHVAALRRARTVAAEAMALEWALLSTAGDVSFDVYTRCSLAKQRTAFPPSLALAGVVDPTGAAASRVDACITGVTLGLQLMDDLYDWEEDFANGGAWMVALSRRTGQTPPSALAEARRCVFASGILARTAEAAAIHFERAALAAGQLEAKTLSRWAEQEAQRALSVSSRELSSPGHALRERALAPLLREVVAR